MCNIFFAVVVLLASIVAHIKLSSFNKRTTPSIERRLKTSINAENKRLRKEDMLVTK